MAQWQFSLISQLSQGITSGRGCGSVLQLDNIDFILSLLLKSAFLLNLT